MKKTEHTSLPPRTWLSLAATVLLGAAVYAYWYVLKPHLIIERELLQMFRFSADYFVDRVVMPAGLARYVADFLSQFFISVSFGALVMALLSMLAQGLSWLLLRRLRPSLIRQGGSAKRLLYALSFVPPLFFVFLMGDLRVQLTLYVAFLMVVGAQVSLPSASPKRAFLLSALLVVVGYWFAGPIVLLAVFLTPFILTSHPSPITSPLSLLTSQIALFVICIVLSLHMVPYPLRIVATGIDYVWPDSQIGTDEEMRYDLLMRQARWNLILQHARKQPPRSAACQHVAQLAAWYQHLIDQHQLAASFGNVRESINSSVSAGLVSDFCMHLAMINIAQRAAFELNESAANYNKSARATKRLAETALCTGQYEVALKYASLLRQTLFYRRWAQEIQTLATHPAAIARHPRYGMLQKVHASLHDQIFI
ncbi:MAG: hypothetical protein J6I61_01725 [Prevotella sp.]|nr:hypothetical protein [Prevotella sp.]